MFHKLFPYFVSGATSKGHRLQTPRWYKYRKSVEPYLCLFSNLRFLQDPSIRISNERPRRIWNATKQSNPLRDALRRDSHIPKGVYCLLALDRVEILQDFITPKQALINAFYNMSAKSIAQLCAAKLQHFFGLSKKNALLRAFFSLHTRSNRIGFGANRQRG